MEQAIKFPQLIAETARWVVLNKPAGWLSIPASRPPTAQAAQLVSNEVLSEWARKNFGPIWIVHRIDRETSGLVLFARSAEDHREANQWFMNHQVKKVYQCLAMGAAQAPTLRIRKPIQGSPSLTQVEVLENYEEGFFGRILLASGRRHQIRIHLSEEGHPLFGDPRYGGPSKISIGASELQIQRVALHAHRLELPTREAFEAPLASDFSEWLKQLRGSGRRV